MSESFDTEPIFHESSTRQYEKGGESFQNLVSYLDELGLFSINGGDQPLSIEDARAFRESLTPEQLQRLAELESADNKD